MRSKASVLDKQRNWALQVGAMPDARGYLSTVEENLFRPMSRRTHDAFRNGSGSELSDSARRSAKMKALHSSAVLVVNVFDYWIDQDLDHLVASLDLKAAAHSIEFEAQFPTGLTGNPPNLDIALRHESGLVVGVESKFTEWLTPKSPRKEHFKAKYFSHGTELWTSVGLPRAQALASALRNGEASFRYLDAAQLLKHALGLATGHRGLFSLYYLFYDVAGHESSIHQQEVERLEHEIGQDVAFHWCTYQEVFRRLAQAVEPKHGAYVGYLRQRYFNNIA